MFDREAEASFPGTDADVSSRKKEEKKKKKKKERKKGALSPSMPFVRATAF